MNPSYPVYVISKGRWESRLTIKALEKCNIPYHVVIEPTEYDEYSSVIDPDNILVLPFHDLGQGSIPARNWVWEHSVSIGAERHWILDDNIYDFYRLHQNMKYRVTDGTIFKVAEDFVNRYENVGLAGFEYAFLADKVQTLQMKGGNTDTVYKDSNNRYDFAKSLQDQHPDVVSIQWKYDRWHHKVDYSPFKSNQLIKRDDIDIPQEPNNYGMKLVKIDSNATT